MNKFMTQLDHLKEGINQLELSLDTFADKDKEIRRDNRQIEGCIEVLKAMVNYYENEN